MWERPAADFTWTLGANTPRDGTHIVEAEAFLLNAPGVSKQVAVNLNRFIPSQVATAGGGIDSRNASAAAAIAWNPSTEGDVFGYTVYRPPPNGNNPPTAPNLTGGSADPAVCSTASISATQCFDTSAASAADANAICPPTPIANPGDKCLDYYVVPFDQLWTSISNPNSYGTNECGSGFTWNSGVGIPSPPNSVAPITQTGNWSTARLGCPSQFIAINYTQGLANSRPPAPTAASPSCSTSSDGLPVINWTPPSVNTDADGDTITSFRVYRDPGSTSPAYTDPASTLGFSTVAPQSFKDPTPPGTGLHSYYVTTVDDHFQESDPLSITWTVGGCP